MGTAEQQAEDSLKKRGLLGPPTTRENLPGLGGDSYIGDDFGLVDSGERELMPTGSQRDSRAGKGRFDLIPQDALTRLARVYEKGAEKYDDDNWRKGQPLRRYADSAIRHIFAFLRGEEQEDHIMQAAWNCFAMAWTEKAIERGDLPASLDDRYECDMVRGKRGVGQ